MKRLLPAFLLPIVMACSGEPPATTMTAAAEKPKTPPPPAAQQARELIAASPELAEYKFTDAAVSLPVAGSAMNESTRAIAKQLASAGWLAFDGSGDIMLTDKSRADQRFLLRPNGILDIVPLARKELGNVTAVRPEPEGTASVDFDWHWVPNDVAASLTSGTLHDRFAMPHRARATLIWDGTSWSVLKIE